MEQLEGFPVVIQFPVAWGEMDAFGHVNNIHFFRYFENARIVYAAKLRLHEHKDQTGIGPIMASTHCRFLHPLTFPDMLSVGAKITKLDTDRFTMRYIVISQRHKVTAAEGEAVIVMYDYRTNRKADMPKEIRDRIIGMEKELAS